MPLECGGRIMTTPTDTKYIVRDADVLGEKPCIQGHRIAAHHIAGWYPQGESAEEIACDFHLTAADTGRSARCAGLLLRPQGRG
jgi:uncharacterized protein (DUF433 family)